MLQELPLKISREVSQAGGVEPRLEDSESERVVEDSNRFVKGLRVSGRLDILLTAERDASSDRGRCNTKVEAFFRKPRTVRISGAG